MLETLILDHPASYVLEDSIVLFLVKAAHFNETNPKEPIIFHVSSFYTAGQAALTDLDEMYWTQAGNKHKSFFTFFQIILSRMTRSSRIVEQ